MGFPQLCLQDGPLGVRATDHNTACPAGITTGATWSKELMYQRGVALGEEFRGKGANFYLGPSVGALGRKPRGGRNWEGFAVDPYLCGSLAFETVQGIQSQGVITSTKVQSVKSFMVTQSAQCDLLMPLLALHRQRARDPPHAT